MKHASNVHRKNATTHYVCAALILFLYYYIYRYVLQYNSDDTSPTYSNTPVLFQLAKYLILILLLAAFLCLSYCISGRTRDPAHCSWRQDF